MRAFTTSSQTRDVFGEDADPVAYTSIDAQVPKQSLHAGTGVGATPSLPDTNAGTNDAAIESQFSVRDIIRLAQPMRDLRVNLVAGTLRCVIYSSVGACPRL